MIKQRQTNNASKKTDKTKNKKTISIKHKIQRKNKILLQLINTKPILRWVKEKRSLVANVVSNDISI